MELNPKAKRMWKYLQEWKPFLHTYIHVDNFCRHNTKMTDEDKELFKQLWLKLNNEEDCCEDSVECCEEECESPEDCYKA